MTDDQSHSFAQNVELATVAIRVRDLDASVNWYRDMLGIEPVSQGADGDTPPYAAYVIGGMVITVWQLAKGDRRDPAENDRNSYLIFVWGGDIEALYNHLVAAGVHTEPLRNSANNRFFWFYDLDDNRWEVSQATTDAQLSEMKEVLEQV